MFSRDMVYTLGFIQIITGVQKLLGGRTCRRIDDKVIL
jgi:hypothetical protein